MRRKRSKKHIGLWILLGVLILLLLGGVACGFMAYRFYQNIRPTLIVEAGGSLPDASAFQENVWDSIWMETDLSGIDTTITGMHQVEFSWGPLHKTAELHILDTTAPTGETRDVVCALGEEPTVEDFVVKKEDVTGVTAFFYNQPDYSKEGKQKVTVILEDGNGNRTTFWPELTIYNPERTPVIDGAVDITIYQGDSISYRTGVSATADQDPNPQLEIDNSKVNLNEPGEYPAYYKATDRFGRSTTVQIRVKVKEKDQAYYDQILLNQLADEVIAEEVTPEMDEIERAFVLFRWVRRHVPWSNVRTERDPIGQALAGMQGHAGDCYTHAITYKTLLDHLGVENIMMKRYPGPGVHYWLLVKINGSWYHVDPSPIYMDRLICFMCTDQDVATFSETVRPHYYDYEYGQYPYTPDTSPVYVVHQNGDYVLKRE